MKQFFKTVFASVLGVLIASGILILGFIFFLVGLTTSLGKEPAYLPENNSILKISLKGSVSDRVEQHPLAALLGEREEQLALTDVVKAIRLARDNNNIKGIYLQAGNLSAVPASLEAIRRALQEFKASNKFILAYGDSYTQGAYYVCSVADSVFLNPQGNLLLMGMASQGVFYPGLAEKVGVEFYIFKAGTYKGAVEPFYLKKYSDANRKQISSFINNIWGNITTAIRQDRGVSAESLDQFINEGKAFADASEAVNYRLVDGLRYLPEVEETLKQLTGTGKKEKLKVATVDKMIHMPQGKQRGDQIAVLYAEGVITEAKNSSAWGLDEKVISEKVAAELVKLKEDEKTKAVVFRVNSPGGSAYISDQIWKEVAELRKVKPIVVSMGDYAASGGYYIACAANRIVAEPTTLTGSIGVYGIIPNVTGLFDKVGLSTDMVKTNTYADLGDISRPMREDEKALIQASVDRTYDTFLSRCAEGRGMEKSRIDTIGQGRVWTGEQALAHGLVDKLGGMDMAIAEAAELAGLHTYAIKEVSTQKDFFSELFENTFNEVQARIAKKFVGEEYDLLRSMYQVRKKTGIQTILPFEIQPL
ncbi:MAG: signal peptide peptidase SppA [Tannerellaceae bacterium]|nr:signal peptide peptidase SppA [Tannerellaceae bacterium]MCD8263409.1 signal peptide peptidase SppA [Tannerellaceae bacterium]